MSDTIFTIANFLESSDEKIRSFTEAVERNTWESVLKKTENVMPDITIDTNHLDSMVDIAMRLGVEAKSVAEYLSNQEVHDYLAKHPTTVKITTKYPISSIIKVSGLEMFVKDLRNLFEDISNGKKNTADVKAWINDPRVIIKYKKNINDACADAYRTSKDVLKPVVKDEVLLDKSSIDSIQNSLYKFSKIYASSYVGKKDERNIPDVSFAHGVVIIKEAIKKNYENIQLYIKAGMKSSIPSSIVEQITYSAKVMYAELCKYTIASYLQFMSERIHDVRTMISLKSQLEEVLSAPNGLKAEMESVGIDPLNYSMDDSDMIIDCIDKTIRDIRALEFDDSESYNEYDKRAYDLPIELLKRLAEMLKGTTEFYREKHGTVSADLIVRRFDLKNAEVWKVLEDTFYGNKYVSIIESNLSLALNDLIHLKNFIPTYKNLIILCMTNVAELVTLIKTVGNEDEEMLNLVEEIKGKIDYIYRNSAKKFVERLNLIYGIAFPARDFSSPVVTDENNYFIDAFNANYDAIEESFHERIHRMNNAYYEAYIESELSQKYSFEDPYFEADQNTDNANQNNQQNTGNQNAPGTTDQNKKPSTTPKVTENTSANNANATQDQTNNGGNTNQTKGSISARIGNFVQNVIDKITGFFNKNGAKTKNLGFIQQHENYLNTRSYANVSLQMLPYIQTDYVATMKGIIQKASTMNANQLKSMSEQNLYDYLYSDTQFARVKGDTPDARFEQAIKVGTNKNEVVTYSNNAIKKMIPAMTTYVKNYYTNIVNDLNGVKNSLKDLDKLNTFKSSGGNDDRTDANVSLIPKIVNTAIGSCINVARQRANDYVVVMNSLVSKQEKDKAKNTQNNQQNTNADNNQQDQNTGTANNQ